MKGVVSLYDVTVQDWYPIADKTDQPGYYVCIGTSGSSFKTAPVLGSLVARIVTASEDENADLRKQIVPCDPVAAEAGTATSETWSSSR